MNVRSTAANRTICTAVLTDDEAQMLRLADEVTLTPGERRELLWYLDVVSLPSGTDRVQAVVERILGDRLAK